MASSLTGLAAIGNIDIVHYVDSWIVKLLIYLRRTHHRINERSPSPAVILYGLSVVYLWRHYWPKLGILTNIINGLHVLTGCIYPITRVHTAVGRTIFRKIWEDMTRFQRIPRLLGGHEDRVLVFDPEAGGVPGLSVGSVGGNRSVPIRVYRPRPLEQILSSGKRLPVMVYYHGGGFVLGNIKSVEHICVEFARRLNFIVVSVDYRLGEYVARVVQNVALIRIKFLYLTAPENRFPAGIMDCIAATEWVHANAAALGGDSSCFLVAGDSAGGNIASIVSVKMPKLVTMQVHGLYYFCLAY
jgi:hypothetical protein